MTPMILVTRKRVAGNTEASRLIPRVVAAVIALLLTASDSIHFAAMRGEVEKVRELIRKDSALVHSVGKGFGDYGYTPLHSASYSGELKVAELLLEHKAVVNAKDLQDRTPLHIAVWNEHKALAEFYLKRGAKIDIYIAVGLGMMERVAKELKADSKLVNARHQDGTMLLHWAARTGQKAIAELLLANNAAVNAEGRIDLFKEGWGGQTPLHEAVIGKHKDIAELLLTRKADVNARDDGEQTPLFYFAIHGGPNGMLRLLLSHKADINARSLGETPLHYAATFGSKDVVEQLLANGAEVNVQDNHGQTPLHEAARRERPDIVEVLLAYKAEINARDKEGRTPLTWVKEKTNMADLLRKHGGKE